MWKPVTAWPAVQVESTSLVPTPTAAPSAAAAPSETFGLEYVRLEQCALKPLRNTLGLETFEASPVITVPVGHADVSVGG